MAVEFPIAVWINVTITHPLGDHRFQVELPFDIPMSHLVPQLLPTLGLPQRSRFALLHQRTERILGPTDTLLSAGIKTSDTLILIQVASAAGAIPIRTFDDIQLVYAAVHQEQLLRDLEGIVLFAIILYTDEDAKLAGYVRQHVSDLHFMSGRCMFFVIEQPQPEFTANVEGYVKQLMPQRSDYLLEKLDTARYRPYNRSIAYKIAEGFDVLPRQFPCIVFFSDLESRRKLVVELRQFTSPSETQDSYSDAFRLLFSYATQTLTYEPGYRLDELSKMLTEEKMRRGMRSFAKGITLSAIGVSLLELLRTLK